MNGDRSRPMRNSLLTSHVGAGSIAGCNGFAGCSVDPGSILSVESNQNMESKTKNVESKT